LKDSNYKRPESVLVVVHTHAGEVLMLQRREPEDFWQSVTGSLKRGESPLAAAHRELREETGLEADIIDCHITNRFPIHPAWRARFAPGTETNLEHVFRAEFASRPEVHLNPREHGAYRWLPRSAAAELASSWTNRDAILGCVAHQAGGS
jgi:dATP pyrophosphohydrolase